MTLLNLKMEDDRNKSILKQIRSKKKSQQDSFLEKIDKKNVDEFELEQELT